MDQLPQPNAFTRKASFLARLARDVSGNTMAIVAASIAPLLALIGGGIDMGRSYLAEARLQQACDAGVLAARKKLGSTVVAPGPPPSAVEDVGDRFFNINYRDGAYGTENRTFTMTMEADTTMKGVATVDVPTTIMAIFGADNVPLKVECGSKLNFSNTDIMMVLDTTLSMNELNKGTPRIQILRDTVRNFHDQIETAKGPGVRVRYGFVPYSNNVNVGALLHDDWVDDEHEYQSRNTKVVPAGPVTTTVWDWNFNVITNGYSQTIYETYAATEHKGTTEYENAWYSCDKAEPADAMDPDVLTKVGTETKTTYVGPPAGDRLIQHYERIRNGYEYSTSSSGATCTIYKNTYDDHKDEFNRYTDPYQPTTTTYDYMAVTKDVTKWRSETTMCVEERATYQIDDYKAVDMSKAMDLDINLVPTSDPDTQWKPMYPDIIWGRGLSWWADSGKLDPNPILDSPEGYYFKPTNYAGLVACPSPSRKLATIDKADAGAMTSFNNYLNALNPIGTTYHDIGMIWGGRLLTKNGLFAAENADLSTGPTSRHLVFLTDGKTEPFDISYGAYGIEPLDRRRWDYDAKHSLDWTVEQRFSVACNQVKSENVTVWVVGFDTHVTKLMEDCAGKDHTFLAKDSSDLTAAFTAIAASMGELRVTR